MLRAAADAHILRDARFFRLCARYSPPLNALYVLIATTV